MQKDGPSFLDSTSSFEIVDVTQTVAVTDFYRQRLASLTLSCLKKTLRRWINVIFPDKRLSYKTNSDVESWWPVDEVQYRPRYLLDKNGRCIYLSRLPLRSNVSQNV